MALARGAALGRFVVLGLVGRGAMGEVYGAYDPDLDRKIAIKLVRAGGGGEGSEGRARLMREAQATAKISHPNVVVVYDAGTFGERVFIAMEFVDGHTLRYWLQEKERPWQEILEAFLAAGRGLAAAHEKELVHRDFKPDNVMVARGGQVRVMDFGLARIAAGAASPGEAGAGAPP
ncbi:MAG TPA: serine/threonine-protein kinase, partial [Polyangia bacterium]|nr:serine/threonine-protein kinase [Polyangia bacterium]